MKKDYFTLIEILGVIALIVILAGIGIGAYTYASESAREKATSATIVRLENAFTALQDKGISGLRTRDGGASTAFVSITFDPANQVIKFGSVEVGKDAAQKKEAFNIFARAMDADNIDSILDDDKCISDAWIKKIYIRYPGKFNRGGFDIISAGSDGVFGVDGASAVPDDISKFKDDDGDIICDDIANFIK